MYGVLVGVALVAAAYGIWVAAAAIYRRIAGKTTTGKAFAAVARTKERVADQVPTRRGCTEVGFALGAWRCQAQVSALRRQ